jgi:hypothetical protein
MRCEGNKSKKSPINTIFETRKIMKNIPKQTCTISNWVQFFGWVIIISIIGIVLFSTTLY